MFLYDEEGAHRAASAAAVIGNDELLRPRLPAKSSACCRRTPIAARPIASICGCGPKGSAARWPARWPARSPITTRWAEPGNGRPSSRSAPSPATSGSARSSSRRSSRSSIANISASPRSTRSRPSNAASSTAPTGPAKATREVKTGHGGIRDVEFTIQFLQLLNGGDLPDIRQRNTLKALAALEDVGCLTDQEYRVLDDTYRFLRKIEHRLQLMFDLQTHRLPDRPDELRKLALRMGYAAAVRPRAERCAATDSDRREAAAAIRSTPSCTIIARRPTLNRTILDHLLHQTFTDEAGRPSPEADLMLDPNPDPERIQASWATIRSRTCRRRITT